MVRRGGGVAGTTLALARLVLVAGLTVSTTLVASPVGAEPTVGRAASFMQPSPTTVGDAGSSPFPSRVDVSGVTGDVLDVDVTLSGVEHQWPDDLDVVLVAPDGTAATVMSDVGGDDQTPATGTALTFDDDASGSVPPGLLSGRYRPHDDDSDPGDPDLEGADATFAELAAAAVNGTWELYVNDDTYDFDGRIASWSLSFQVTDRPLITGPASGSVLPGSTIPVRGSGSPGATVYVGAAQQPARTVTVAADGTWAVDLTGLADGSHLVTASSGPGRTGSSTTVRLDSTAPTGTLVLRTVRGGPEVTSSRRVYLDVAAGEPLRGIRVSNDGAAYGPLVPVVPGGVAWLLSEQDGTRRVFVQLEDLVGNVSNGYLSDTVTLDRVAPRILQSSPRAGAVGVRRDKVITARFDDFVTPNSGVSPSYLVRVFRAGSDRPLRATVRYDPATATVRALPHRPLRPRTRFKVVVSGFEDAAGNWLDQDPAKAGTQPGVWRFRTR